MMPRRGWGGRISPQRGPASWRSELRSAEREEGHGGRSHRVHRAQGSGGERRHAGQAFRITAAERADEVAIRTKEDAFTITWGELRERVDALAGGLAALGLERGQTLALLLGNRPEFHICDLAAMMLGATPFSIYNTYTAEQIHYLLDDAEASIVICEQQYLPRVLEARGELPRAAST